MPLQDEQINIKLTKLFLKYNKENFKYYNIIELNVLHNMDLLYKKIHKDSFWIIQKDEKWIISLFQCFDNPDWYNYCYECYLNNYEKVLEYVELYIFEYLYRSNFWINIVQFMKDRSIIY